MAWVAPVGKRSWRVRYRDANGDERSVGGFRSVTEARAYAEALETDRRRGAWIDPARSATPLIYLELWSSRQLLTSVAKR